MTEQRRLARVSEILKNAHDEINSQRAYLESSFDGLDADDDKRIENAMAKFDEALNALSYAQHAFYQDSKKAA